MFKLFFSFFGYFLGKGKLVKGLLLFLSIMCFKIRKRRFLQRKMEDNGKKGKNEGERMKMEGMEYFHKGMIVSK